MSPSSAFRLRLLTWSFSCLCNLTLHTISNVVSSIRKIHNAESMAVTGRLAASGQLLVYLMLTAETAVVLGSVFSIVVDSTV